MRHLLLIATLTLFATVIIGCGGGNPQGRVSLTGTVTLDDEPLTEGTISFEPVGGQILKIRNGALIRNGKYTMPAAQGLVPGEYLVQIISQKDTGRFIKQKNKLDGSEEDVREIIDLIPPEYGAASSQRITVTNSPKQKFDFSMKSSR